MGMNMQGAAILPDAMAQQQAQARFAMELHQGFVSQIVPIVANAHYMKWAKGEDWQGKPNASEIAKEAHDIAFAVMRGFGINVKES